MSADIDASNNRNNMAYKGELPWHGVGQQLEQGATIEDWSTASGLDWTVKSTPARYVAEQEDGEPIHKSMPNRSVLYRSDTLDALSVMSDNKYNVVQPHEVLEFYRDLVNATDGEFELETAGSLAGGRKIWALAKAKTETVLLGQDRILPYLMLATSFDGSMSTIGKFTTVRVVCSNMLAMATAKQKSDVRIPHSTVFNPDQVKQDLGLYKQTFAQFTEQATRLATKNVTEEQAIDFFARLYGPEPTININTPLPDPNAFSTNRRNTINELMAGWVDGPGADLMSARGTIWGLVNAVTHHQDHTARTRASTDGDERQNRFNAAQFGSGARIKNNAMALANELLTV